MVPLNILAAQSAILSMADQQSRLILSCLAESAMMVCGLTAADCIALQVAGLHTASPRYRHARLSGAAALQHWVGLGTALSLSLLPPLSDQQTPLSLSPLSQFLPLHQIFLSLHTKLPSAQPCLGTPLSVIVGVGRPGVSRGLILLLTDYS